MLGRVDDPVLPNLEFAVELPFHNAVAPLIRCSRRQDLDHEIGRPGYTLTGGDF
jgi:hypothetical protein